MPRWLALVVLAGFWVSPALAQKPAPELRLVAAGSLVEPFTQLIAIYEKTHRVEIVPHWGPSGALRDQLEAGAPFDIFASAALAHAKALTDKGISGPTRLFARNALCAVTLKNSPIGPKNLVESLLDPAVRLGTSTPKSDPAGDYTFEIFAKIGAQHAGAEKILDEKAEQIFGGPSTTGPLNGRHRLTMALEDKMVDVVIYYCSWARQAQKKPGAELAVIAFPDEAAVGADYGVTVATGAGKAAEDFAQYLLSPPAQAILRDHGFIAVAPPADQ